MTGDSFVPGIQDKNGGDNQRARLAPTQCQIEWAGTGHVNLIIKFQNWPTCSTYLRRQFILRTDLLGGVLDQPGMLLLTGMDEINIQDE